MRACSVDLAPLQKSLTDYIDNGLRAIVVETGAFPGKSRPTAAFHRVMQRAQTHAEQMGQQEITGNNMMVVIFAERISPAVRRSIVRTLLRMRRTLLSAAPLTGVVA